MALETYRKKRQFGITSEPRGRKGRGAGDQYVIQKHAARRLHYDLRLELDGVMKSWAVTRGPSLDPADKRLAVHVEDHPIEYNTFEGTIPAGEYGGGTVMIWDRGNWTPDGDPHRGYAKGHLDFELEGDKLHGRWHLVRMRGRANDRHENWLLIKGKDEYARSGRDAETLEKEAHSVATGRTMDEIAGGKGKKRVWHSNRRSDGRGAAGDPKPQTQRAFKEELRAARAQASARAKAPKKAVAKPAIAPRAKPKAKRSSAAARTALTKDDPAPSSGTRRAPLPDFVVPSLATLHENAPRGPEWLHEIKFDGYRIEARLDRGKVTLLTRNRQDWTHRFAPIADAVAALPAQTALLDGEVVVEDKRGRSNFSLLQIALKEGGGERFVYWVFDLLYLDGKDLRDLPLIERKAALQRLVKKAGTKPIRFAEDFETEGPLFLRRACELGLEGVVSKRRDAPYRSGRTENFIKSKCHDEQEFVVAGFTPSAAMPKAIGALTVAFREGGELRYAGRVGTGYTHETARDLWKRLEKLRAAQPPIAVPKTERRKNVIWVKPDLVIEAEYRGITHDGLLRQAAYKGLREDKPAREVVRERPVEGTTGVDGKPSPERGGSAREARRGGVARRTISLDPTPTRRPSAAGLPLSGGGNPTSKRPAKKATSISARRSTDPASFHLTHPDRVYWSDVGVTKGDLAAYYVSVWDWIKPHIVGRALSLVRAPEGVGGETFFQKHIPSIIKESSVRHLVDGKEHDVIAVETLDDLIALVQSGALEIHVRGSRLDSLETCDRIVFDLDPGDGVPWKEIAAAARETRERLKALKLETFVKLSGGKGVHVVLPIADVDWEVAKDFAQEIALGMARDSPQRYVGKMTRSLRKGKIFIDYFRNSREATSVAAYSTRARAGAPVSAPLSWEQLSRVTAANQFTVLNLKKHFRSDPWRDIGKVKQRLPKK